MAFHTIATCDKCGKCITWNIIATKSYIESWLRKREGWTIGKQHLCATCRNPKK